MGITSLCCRVSARNESALHPAQLAEALAMHSTEGWTIRHPCTLQAIKTEMSHLVKYEVAHEAKVHNTTRLTKDADEGIASCNLGGGDVGSQNGGFCWAVWYSPSWGVSITL